MAFTTSRIPFIGLVLIALLVGCHRERHEPGGESCGRVNDDVADRLIEQYPFSKLDDDVQDRIRDTWGKNGRLCLVANQSAQSCNAGNARRAERRTCCHIDSPNLRLTNVPETITIQDDASKPALVDLKLTGVASNRAESSRCAVPSCEDDAIAADALLHVEGSVRLEEETVKVSLDLQLDRRLELVCDVPGSDADSDD